MIAASNCTQLATVRIDPTRTSELCHISLACQTARVTQEEQMEHIEQNEQSMYQSNFRAEDGPANGKKIELYEGVVIPLATLGAVLLFVAGAMVLTH